MRQATQPRPTINQCSSANCFGQVNGVIALSVSIIAIGLVWGVALPWYAAQPAMKEHLQFLEEQGIDPSAMFYTELDAMDKILEKIENGR